MKKAPSSGGSEIPRSGKQTNKQRHSKIILYILFSKRGPILTQNSYQNQDRKKAHPENLQKTKIRLLLFAEYF